MEDIAIRAGPTTNFIAMANTAIRVPHAIMLARDAMKRPVRKFEEVWILYIFFFLLQFTICGREILVVSLPKLNIAIPSPPSDKIDIDRSIIVGNSTPHLQQVKQYC